MIVMFVHNIILKSNVAFVDYYPCLKLQTLAQWPASPFYDLSFIRNVLVHSLVWGMGDVPLWCS